MLLRLEMLLLSGFLPFLSKPCLLALLSLDLPT
jgi:hypothetical protein